MGFHGFSEKRSGKYNKYSGWAAKTAASCAALGMVFGGIAALGAGRPLDPTPLVPAPANPAPAAPLAAASAFAKRTVIPYKTLTWDDFRVDDSAQGMTAETGTALSFRYAARTEKTDKSAACVAGQDAPYPFTARVSRMEFSGGFDCVHSWRRSDVLAHPDAAHLLAHEQGHLDIAEAGRLRLEKLPMTVYPEGHGMTQSEAASDLRAHLTLWFRAELARINIRQLQYDMETEFSTKKNTQREWNARLTAELREIRGATNDAAPGVLATVAAPVSPAPIVSPAPAGEAVVKALAPLPPNSGGF